MEIEKLKKIISGNKNVGVQHLKQFSAKLTEETTNTSVVSDLPKLIPAVFKYAMHEEKKFREAALPALTELAGLLDLNKHLKEKIWWTEMKAEILKRSVDVLMNLVSTGDDQWSELWMTTVMLLGSDLRSELPLLNRLLKVVEKAFKMNDEEVRHQGFECWCKLIDNFSINKQEINNKRRLGLLVIPLKANNHNTPRLCASKMKTWKHLLSKLDQHNEMTVQLLVTHFLEFMFTGVGSIAPACKTLNAECANIFSQMLQTPLLFRILPQLFIKHTFVCIEHVHRDLSLCTGIWEGLLDDMKSNQWTETHVSELMTCLTNASNNDKLGKSKTFAHMIKMLYSGNHALPSATLVKHLKEVLSLALEPHVLVNYTEAWCSELLNIVAETDPIQMPPNIVGLIIAKLNILALSELFRDEKLKLLRGMWMILTNILCKWMSDDGQIGKNGTVETDLQNIHQLLLFGAAPLSSMWNKLQMKSWKSLYSECVKYFSLSTEVKCEKFVSDLVELLLEGIQDKKIPLHVALDLVSIILEFHLSKDESSILPLMMEVAESTMNSFHNDTSGTSALLNQYMKIILVAARSEPSLVNDILTVTDKMLISLEDTPLIEGHIDKTRNAILKTQIQLNALKPCRSQDRSESSGTNISPANSPTMTSFMHRLAKSKETKSKVGSPTPSQSSDVSASPSRTPNSKKVSSSPSHTPNSKKASSPFCDMKSEDFVFVPPKPRKILLTDHQKESFTTRKHDIPALYQDLSQDSSQSAFESFVTPVQVTDKEQIEKETTSINSPKNFKEVNFKNQSPKKSLITNMRSSTSEDKLAPVQVLEKEQMVIETTLHPPKNLKEVNLRSSSPKKSLITNLRSSTSEDKLAPVQVVENKQMEKETTLHPPKNVKEVNLRSLSPKKSLITNLNSSTSKDKLQNNKENDCVNNNTKSPIKSSSKEMKNSGGTEDAPLKVLQEEKKRSQDHVSENIELPKVLPGNTRLRSRKSLAGDLGGNQSLTGVEEKTRSVISDLQEIDGDSDSVCRESTNDEILNKVDKSNDEINPSTNPLDKEMKTKDTEHNVTTPRHSNTEVSTPKRSLRKSKLIISVKKSIRKNEQGNKQEKQNEKEKSLSNSGIKSQSSTITPKVSPRRLRKRKSGVTPVLTGGEFIKKVRTSQSPLSCNITPINSANKSVGKSETPLNVKNCNKVSKQDLLVLKDDCKETISITDDDEADHNMDIKRSTSKSATEKTKSDINKNEVEKKQCTKNAESTIKTASKNTENNGKVSLGVKDDDIEIVAIIEGDKNILRAEIEEKDKTFLKTLEDENKVVSSKCHLPLKDSVTCIDISFSPVKVVVERLPDIIISANQLGIQEERETSSESTKKTDIVKKRGRAVKNITSSFDDASKNDLNCESEDNIIKSDDSDSKDIEKEEQMLTLPVLDTTDGKLDIVNKKERPVKNNESSFDASGHDLNCKSKDNITPYNSYRKSTAREGNNLTLPMVNMSDLNLDETCIERKNNEPKGNKIINKEKDETEPSKTEGNENIKYGNEKSSAGKFQNDSAGRSFSPKKTRSIDKNETSLYTENCNGEINSRDGIDSEKALVKETNEDSTDLESTPVKKTPMSQSLKLLSDSVTKTTGTSDSPSSLCKRKSSENTPVKNGQKQLKQTQLPFTPIRKTVVPEPKSNLCTETESSEKQDSSTLDGKEGKSPLLVLTKIETSEINKALCSPKSERENKKDSNDEAKPTLDSQRTNGKFSQPKTNAIEAEGEHSLSNNMSETRQEGERTPEKTNTSATATLVLCLERTEVEVSEKSVVESPNKITESEDIIASSQETDVTTQSILVSYRNSSSSNSLKLLSKSPKKCENTSQAISSCERVLRSSPLKTENSRFTGTPVKKSVCRRLDVEIEESPDFEVNSVPASTEGKSLECEEVTNKDSEELSDDFKLLNGDSATHKNNSLLSSSVSEILNRLEDTQPLSTDCSPKSNKNLKRFAVEADASCGLSPKRAMGSLRFDGSDSPISSPNSRTSQMMELAKQEKERTISSPISSVKRRRILPIRVGPVTRTPKSQIIQRTHSGPSEEWVRRTYSPTASPNSSILKRSLLVSPDSSPPSSKKKRVSFLDPPVSESLLFSKAIPGKGQIQRPEPKYETDSEELPSQGSVGVEVTETSSSEAKVFSPLKQCSSPLTDILERIVNFQWMSELEAQLERMGVTTVGQLSLLPEETVQRLPFIPPKLERLRKILQNYYNEINEKPDDRRLTCSKTSKEECLSPGKEGTEAVIDSPEKIVENREQQNGGLESSDEDISSIAESIKLKLEECPELISELGNTLNVDVVMKLLNVAVCKLKKDNDKS